MDIDEMKRQWAGLNSRIGNIETNINNQKLDKMKTAQQQLVHQYRTLACVSAIFIGISYLIFSRLFGNLWIEVGFAAFFTVTAVIDFTLQHKVSEIDLGAMPVADVAQKAASCRRLHHIFQLILIPSAIVLLAYLAYTITDNKAFIYGMCIGGAIGLAFGLKVYFKFMDNYKNLIRE